MLPEMPIPPRPMIYHITRVENLAAIIASGGLLSDRKMIAKGGPAVQIGMTTIKQSRLVRPVRCHGGTMVGDYVPFYFCPRSIMLYMLHCGNHPNLQYREGQESIVHLEADLQAVVGWARTSSVRWAFTLSNAAGVYAEFRADPAHLGEINWDAVDARLWSDPDIKEGKQAEFLVHEFFPWNLVERIGVNSHPVARQTASTFGMTSQRPRIEVLPGWYY
jgi:hypothetical protein